MNNQVTNREQLLAEISAMSNRQLANLLLDGGYDQPLGLIMCQDCQARQGKIYNYDCGVEDCAGCEVEWMAWPCRRRNLLTMRR